MQKSTLAGLEPSGTTVEPTTDHRECTPVGVDLGVNNLLTASPITARPEVPEALVIDGSVERALYEEASAVIHRLKVTPGDTTDRETSLLSEYQEHLTERFGVAVGRVLAYLAEYDDPVVVLEDLRQEPRALGQALRESVAVGTWVLPAVQRKIEGYCQQAGVPVEYVDHEGTSRECHVCGREGTHTQGGRLRCRNLNCPVELVCRDKSAAVSIAKRFTGTSREYPCARCETLHADRGAALACCSGEY